MNNARYISKILNRLHICS